MTGRMAGVRRHRCTTWPLGRNDRSRRRLRAVLAGGIAAGLALVSSAVAAQEPAGSLVVNPQQGATPRPIAPSPSLSPLPASPVPEPVTVPTGPPIVVPPVALPPVVVAPRTPAGPASGSPLGTAQADDGRGLPAPSGDPLAIDPASDPILRLARSQSSSDAFHRAIAEAVRRNPALDEVNAQAEEADQVRREAKARALPTADLSLSTFQVIDRAFSNDPRNILERSRPRERTDGLLRVQQPVIDFGASLNRIRASEARLEAARAEVEDTGTQLALRAVSAWYSVYGYRVLIRLAEAFGTSQASLRASIEQRVKQGAAAPADVAQVDSYIASADAQRADFKRQLLSAEAQYAAVIGSAPPSDLARAPVPSLDGIVAGSLAGDIDRLPAVRAARLGTDAAKRDAEIALSDVNALEESQAAQAVNYIASRRSRDVIAERFRVSRGTVLELLSAQSNYFGVTARYIQSMIELDSARYALLARTGRLLPALGIAPAALETR